MAPNYDAFWEWFAENSASCLSLLQHPEKTALTQAAFEMIFRRYCSEGLYVHLEWTNQETLPCIIISTHGNYTYFQQVEAMVAAAPLSLPWEVMAFEPPRPANHLIRELFPRLAFDASDLLFLPLEMYKDVNALPPVLTIYIDSEKRLTQTDLRAAEHVVYNVLGEKSCIQDLSDIELVSVYQLTEAQQEETAPIELLPEFIIDLSPPAFGVDAEGKLSEL